MRKIVLSTFLLFSVFCCFGQTSNKRVCRLGFTYDISQNSNWGKNNLVVTSVSPYSNAEKAGIQPYDIITHIESIPVSDVSNDEIAQLLNPANKRNIMLTIKSTSSPSREVILNKECKQINEISENQLAMAFNMYSLETTSEREFVCPFKTVATTDTVDFGQFRSYNRHEEQKNRLVLSVFAREIEFIDEEPDGARTNHILLEGYMCKRPVYRKTPLGREIADLLLAVNRPYGKSDYIPCICWGRNARYASGFDVGEHVRILGRIQSREYVKKLSETETETRTAYEVSVSKLECMDE